MGSWQRISFVANTAALPTPTAAIAGQERYVANSSGVAAAKYLCAKGTDDAYHWIQQPVPVTVGAELDEVNSATLFDWNLYAGGRATFNRYAADAGAARVIGRKGRGTAGTPAIVNDGDSVFDVLGYAHDGVTALPAWGIHTVIDGTPGVGYVPTTLSFKTVDSSGLYAERVILDSSLQKVFIPTYPLQMGSMTIDDGVEGEFSLIGFGIAEIRRYQGDAGSARLNFYKARGTQASPASVQTNDSVGSLTMHAHDGTGRRPTFSIESVITGSPGLLYVPSTTYFKTHDQSSAYQNRLIFDLTRTYLPILGGYDGVSVGTSSVSDGFSPSFGVVGSTLGYRRYSTNATALTVNKDKSRGSQSTPTTVANSDGLLQEAVRAFDGTSYVESFRVNVTVNGTVSTGIVPVDVLIRSADSGGTLRVREKFGPTRNYIHGSNGNVSGVTIGTDADVSGATENITLWGNQTGRRRYTTDTSGVGDAAYKARGSATAPTTILTGDAIHYEQYYAHDGTSFVETYRQSVEATGTVSTGVIPGLVRFWSNDNAGALRVRMVFGSTRNYLHGSNGSVSGVTIGTDADVSGASSDNVTFWGNTVGRRRYSADATAALSPVYKARGTATAPAAVVNADGLFLEEVYGHDGTSFVKAVESTFSVDNTVSTGVVPAKWLLRMMNSAGSYINKINMASDGGTAMNDTFYIGGSTGYVGIGSGASTPAAPLHTVWSTTDIPIQQLDYYYTGASNPGRMLVRKARGTSSAPTNVSDGDQIGSLKHQARVSGSFVDVFEMYTTIGNSGNSASVDFRWRHPDTTFPTFMSISPDLTLTLINNTTSIANGGTYFRLNPLANAASISAIPFVWKKVSGSIASLDIGDDGAGHGILRLIDSTLPGSRKLLHGYFTEDGTSSRVQLFSNNAAALSSSIWSGNAGDANTWTLRRYRGSIGSNTTVQNGDYIAKLGFQGFASTTSLLDGAYIAAVVDGTISGDNVPMKLVIATRDTSPALTERHAFHASGVVTFGSTTNNGSGARVQITGGLEYSTFLINGQTTRVTSGTNHTVSGTTHTLVVASTFTGTVTLRAPIKTSDEVIIKNRTASTVTIDPDGVTYTTIDGSASVTIPAGEAKRFLADGTEWVVI